MKSCIRFSAGRHTYDNCPNQMVAEDFSILVEHLETHRGKKKGLDYVCGPMSFGSHDKTQKDPKEAHYRLASHAEPCSFLTLDIDYMNGPSVQDAVLNEIEKLCSYAYETASSTPEVPRLRVFIALDRDVSRHERIVLGTAFQKGLERELKAKFGYAEIEFDKSVYRSEQPNYNPTIGARSWKFFLGPQLKVDAMLSQGVCTDKQESTIDINPKPTVENNQNTFGMDKNGCSVEWKPSTSIKFFGAVTQDAPTPFQLMQINSAFSVIPSDDRDLWIKLGHAAKTLDEDGGEQGKQAWLQWSRKSPKFDLEDAERVWSSLTPTKTSYEQVIRTAVGLGWDSQAETSRICSMLALDKATDHDDIESNTTSTVGTLNNSSTKNIVSSNLQVLIYGEGLMDAVASMPCRKWQIPRLLLVGYLSLIVGPGGVAKSMLQLIAAVSVATGRDLLGLGPVHKCNALVINNEDDKDELQRRIAAVLVQFEIDPVELEGTLFTISGYMQPLRFAFHLENTVTRGPALDHIESLIQEREIGALFVDPFISMHTAPENDNNAMDQVVSICKILAGKLGIAINIAHHTRKIGGDSEAHAGDAESGRGASAIKDAARAAVTIARMGCSTAQKLGFSDEERGNYIRMDVGKMNFAAHDSKANWYKIEAVSISNGDTVGVPKPINLDHLFLQAQDSRKKWTAESMAAAILSLFPTNADEVPWSLIKNSYMNAHCVGSSVAGTNITLLPKLGEVPVQVGNYEMWITQTAPRNGWMVHRKGVFNA
jgi:hypothetical protein